jgi:hypothetical protein
VGDLSAPGPDSSITFDVDLVGCDSATITPVSISDITYAYSDISLTSTIDFADWAESIGTCGPFTYSSTLSNGNSLPSMITFDPTLKEFAINQNQIVLTTTYSIEVFGDIPSPGSDGSTTFSITLTGCDSASISTNSVTN